MPCKLVVLPNRTALVKLPVLAAPLSATKLPEAITLPDTAVTFPVVVLTPAAAVTVVAERMAPVPVVTILAGEVKPPVAVVNPETPNVPLIWVLPFTVKHPVAGEQVMELVPVIVAPPAVTFNPLFEVTGPVEVIAALVI